MAVSAIDHIGNPTGGGDGCSLEGFGSTQSAAVVTLDGA